MGMKPPRQHPPELALEDLNFLKIPNEAFKQTQTRYFTENAAPLMKVLSDIFGFLDLD